MGKTNYIPVLAIIIFLVSACGAKGSLENLRQDSSSVYVNKIFNIHFENIKNNIMESRIKNGSILKKFENNANDMITLVRQDDKSGEIFCFFDFIKEEDNTRIIVYDYICSKNFIHETLKNSTMLELD